MPSLPPGALQLLHKAFALVKSLNWGFFLLAIGFTFFTGLCLLHQEEVGWGRGSELINSL